ncbi:DVU0772 family protein [Desulfohalovibrio reitneri]|uniref:DVU0772 family protein n=1 Tax=Desulfohalovibrio reitneri TaxID=1307759 RepID=UPI0004A76175|nr:hypothetical protein [Desulfohalovibrio reitneri]
MGLEDCRSWLEEVDWDLIQEDAITKYLEWGNNNYRDDLRRPVTLSDEYSIYFVVDTWDEPKIALMKMSKWGSETLCEKKLPEELVEDFYKESGRMRGIFEPTQAIKEWIRGEIEKVA